tara:strand:- start:1746 stop:2666 length:921 start_codon:yes stop_codon:yes gene_type:complete
MKIYVNNPGENWIIDRIRENWYKHKSEISTENQDESDLVWIVAPWQWQYMNRNLLQRKRVLCTIHHIVPDKFDSNRANEFLARDAYVDAYHVPNKYTAHFVRQLTSKPIYVVGYWFDSSLWYPMENAKIRKKLGIDEDRFVVGSFQRDTEGSDLKSPKLEKGPDLFCDYVEKIKDKKTLVLLGGWRRQYIMNRLNSASIEYKYIEMAPIDQVREMYAASDLYVVSSRYEGGPQALLEASAMKVPIISTRMGAAEDILCENCIIDIEKEVYIPTSEDVVQNYKNVQKYDIITHIENYVSMFKEVLKK